MYQQWCVSSSARDIGKIGTNHNSTLNLHRNVSDGRTDCSLRNMDKWGHSSLIDTNGRIDYWLSGTDATMRWGGGEAEFLDLWRARRVPPWLRV